MHCSSLQISTKNWWLDWTNLKIVTELHFIQSNGLTCNYEGQNCASNGHFSSSKPTLLYVWKLLFFRKLLIISAFKASFLSRTISIVPWRTSRASLLQPNKVKPKLEMFNHLKPRYSFIDFSWSYLICFFKRYR